MTLYIGRRWDTFKMLALDPGLHHLGMSVHEIHTRSGQYRNIEIETIDVDRTFNRRGLDDENISLSDRCLMKIRNHVYDLVYDEGISVLVYESPFFNPTRPNAFRTLCEVTGVVRQAAIDAMPSIFIDFMSPQNIKKGVGAGGTKGKDIMREKVMAIQEIVDHLSMPFSELTPDCIDSLAIGYNARNTILAPMEDWKL